MVRADLKFKVEIKRVWPTTDSYMIQSIKLDSIVADLLLHKSHSGDFGDDRFGAV